MTRVERVAALIREEVSRIIREDVSDPRIGFISLTNVNLSPDLEVARIGVSVLADEKHKEECMRGLRSATSFIRGKLGERLETRIVPELIFVRDDSLEKASRVYKIISDQSRKKDERTVQRRKKSVKKR